ncbi:MAG TPA: class I SAM-dependent methyltransferase [Edaphobacter sp.]|jgi:2-polyprenyl-3-methyl-5-hydroxy-6-metoxy-1,4-benzoquinol methylase|nr:class I SAM-dependent methyltransferase [Edaphobacter sp.]
MITSDKSNGYETIAEQFIRARNTRIGPATVSEWSRSLKPNATILELGCGHGVISQTLVDRGFDLYAIDASPKLIHAFREHFPLIPTECAAVEESNFFNRAFDAILAWGLIFLMPPESQKLLIVKSANALAPGGQLLFTAPQRAIEWKDSLTNLQSISLGAETYEKLLNTNGFTVIGGDKDEGDNFYYIAQKPFTSVKG